MRPHTVLPLPGLALFYRTWLAHTGNTPTLSPDSKPGTRLEPGSNKPPKRVDVTKQLYGFYFLMLGAYALKHQAHVRVDLLINRFSPTTRKWTEIAGYLIFFFPFAWVFLTRSYDFAMRSLAQGETTYGAVQLPVYPLKMSMVLAAALLLLQGIAEVVRLLTQKEAAHHDA